MNECRVALVTGAGRGIGRGIALALGKAGWAVVVNYRADATAAADTVDAIEAGGGTARALQADIGVAAERERLVAEASAHFGRIDLLVNNAGVAPRQRVDLLEVGEASYDEVMTVNLKGPFFLTQRVARLMLEQTAAAPRMRPLIVNIGSLSAYVSSNTRGEYCLSKAGLAMMTMLFADRLAVEGISVFEVRPGIIETDMTSAVKEKYDISIAAGLTPIRRWGTPQDVAQAVLAIAEGHFPFSTGEVINVDGGFHVKRL